MNIRGRFRRLGRLLELLEGATRDLSAIAGPAIEDIACLAQINKQIRPGDVAAERKPLNWIFELPRIVRQFRDEWYDIFPRKTEISTGHIVMNKLQDFCGISLLHWDLKYENWSSIDWHSLRDFRNDNLKLQWNFFARRIQTLDRRRKVDHFRCLKEGRILAWMPIDGRACLVPPTAWRDHRVPKVSPDAETYLCSRDLPRSFLVQLGPRTVDLIGVESDAKVWLSRLVSENPDRNILGTKDRALKELRERFRFSEKAAARVWRDVTTGTAWARPGRRSKVPG